MFDPRSPYQRRMWHYESDRPLSVAQLIAAGSLDIRAAALLWLLVERRRSIIVSGPTDPTPGVGSSGGAPSSSQARLTQPQASARRLR